MEAKLVKSLYRYTKIKEALFRFERSEILEVYFARLDGREKSREELNELYDFSLDDLRLFLSGKFKEDPIVQQMSHLHSLVLESTQTN